MQKKLNDSSPFCLDRFRVGLDYCFKSDKIGHRSVICFVIFRPVPFVAKLMRILNFDGSNLIRQRTITAYVVWPLS